MMPEQLSLALARRTDPPTSRIAAARVNVSDLESLVVNVLRAHPAGMTSHEVAAALGRELVSISPRMRPLVNRGKVCEGGRRAGAAEMTAPSVREGHCEC